MKTRKGAGADPTLKTLEPLSEVVLGVSFVAPAFSLVDYGLFYDCIRADFPRVSTQNPIATATEYGQPVYVPSLPRVWLESNDQHSLVQLQENKLIYNWKKVAGAGTYPHFDAVFGALREIWSQFKSCLEDRGPIIEQQFELSYINNIQTDFRDRVEGSLFKWESKKWNQFLPDPTYKVVQYVFKMDDRAINLKATTRPAIEISSQKEVTSFQLDATSTRITNFDAWFYDAHELIEGAFEDLLTEDALKLWRETRS